MTTLIRQLCALSVFCGLSMNLVPRGGVKRLTSLCCSLLLILTLFRIVGAEDFQLSADWARYRAMESSLAAKAGETAQTMNRRTMEELGRACIRERAEQLGLSMDILEMEFRWNDGGFWVPAAVTIRVRGNLEGMTAMQDWIEAELGIGKNRQVWEIESD